MIEKRILEEILGIAVSTGADFAEVYCELTRNGNVDFLDGRVDSIGDNTVSGVGIRIFLGTKTVYSSTSDTSYDGLVRCAKSVAAALSDTAVCENIRLTERIFPNIHPVKVSPASADMKLKTDLLRECCEAARNYDQGIYAPECRSTPPRLTAARCSPGFTDLDAAWDLRPLSFSRPAK